MKKTNFGQRRQKNTYNEESITRKPLVTAMAHPTILKESWLENQSGRG